MTAIYDDIMKDISDADYVLFGTGKEIYNSASDDTYNNLMKIVDSQEHMNYFIVSTDKDGRIRNTEFNPKRIVCPLNNNNSEEEEKQWDFYNKWLSSSLAKKLVVIELGEDFSNPNVIRWPFERMVMINQKSRLYRINNTFYQIPGEISKRAIPVHMDASRFVKELVNCC